MWRRLLAAVHPDKDLGDNDLFVWVNEVLRQDIHSPKGPSKSFDPMEAAQDFEKSTGMHIPEGVMESMRGGG